MNYRKPYITYDAEAGLSEETLNLYVKRVCEIYKRAVILIKSFKVDCYSRLKI